MRRLPRISRASAALVLLAASAARADFTDKISTSPIIIQDGFAPGGDMLPYGGQEFCCPTAATISLAYLAENGFTQLAPADPTTADELNLDQVLSGLMSTSATTGTPTVADITAGISTYLSAKGIASSDYTLTVTASPTIAQLSNLNQSGTVVDLIDGFYSSSGSGYTRNGGHSIALLDENGTAGGQSSPSSLLIDNPLPGALAPVADLSTSAVQSLNTISTTGGLTAYGALELNPSQYPSFWGSTQTVVETAIALTINPAEQTANTPSPAAWTLSAAQILNPNGGTLTVAAPIQPSSYGIDISTPGTVELQNTDASTGANTITAGTLRGDAASGAPFGTGGISLSSATLQISPTGNSSNISLSAVTVSGGQLVYSGGSVLNLDPPSGTSLTLQIGGNTNASTPNLFRGGNGTLVIAVAAGIANLGSTQQLQINGTAANLPTVTDGIVTPSIIGQDNDANASGDFLTYGSAGFARANYTEATVTPLTAATSTTVYDAEISQNIPAQTTASVYALKLGPVAITGGNSSTLDIGGGAILNGGTISAANLNFGSSEALIYASAAGGTINSNIQGSAGLTTFGSGALTLTSANHFTGGTHINSGTLIAANSTGSVTGTGAVTIAPNATLQINPGANAGGSGGATVSADATVLLNGGALSGSSTFDQGSYLLGSGTIAGAATFSGTIGNPATDFANDSYTGVEDIDFTAAVTMNDLAIYDWRLNALDSTPQQAGIDFSLLDFTSPGVNVKMGTSSSPINITLDLGPAVADPDSSNSFWSAAHQWTIATDAIGFKQLWYHWNFPSYSDGYFSLSNDSAVENLYLDYTPVPEPARMAMAAMLAMLIPRPRRTPVI